MNNNCPACGGVFKQFAAFGQHIIYQCSSCGLGHTSNTEKQTGDYHRDEVYIKEELCFTNIFQRRVNLINHFVKVPGKILDIGSSTGLMLSLFQKQGWQVQGIEISKKAAEFAIQRGIPTMITTLEQAKLQNNYFDAVVINHTLEHLEDPQATVKKARTILKSGGVLLIDVPNFGSLSAQAAKDNWPYLLPDEHIWHFTAKAITKMLEKEGLAVINRTSPSGIWDYANPWYELWSALSSLKKRFFKEFLTMLPDYFVSILQTGTSLTIVAKKND